MSIAYPRQYGYCDLSDVSARIKGGQYNPDSPGAISSEYLAQFVTQAAAEIDLVLAKAGYSAPPVPLPNTTVGEQVYSLLLNINATYAAGLVEMWRHTTDIAGQDSQAKLLLDRADAMLTRIETGKTNLAVAPFNCAGPFSPDADPGQAMDNLDTEPDPLTARIDTPIFTTQPQQSEPINILTNW